MKSMKTDYAEFESDKYIMEKIKLGVRDTVNRLVAETKSMASINQPAVYQDMFGPLSTILRQMGLQEVTESGALRDAWNNNINAMVASNAGTTSKFYILNTGLLNQKTEWWGVTGSPSIQNDGVTNSKVKSEGILIGGFNIVGAGSISNSDSAMRPLPSSTKSGFAFSPNPFPGYGYWKLYHDGLASSDISYAPNPFIAKSFKFIFGGTAVNMIDNPLALRFSSEFRVHTSQLLGTLINKRLGR